MKTKTKYAGCFLATVLLVSTSLGSEKFDPGTAVWHIGLDAVFGPGGKPGVGHRLDIYPVFEKGKWVNALATARGYNTSIHFIEKTDVTFNREKLTFKGSITALVTPDPWVPKDGKPYTLQADVEGRLIPTPKAKVPYSMEGAYTASRPDGGPVYGEERKVNGKIIGKAEPAQTGWNNSAWTARMMPVTPPGSIDVDSIEVTLGIHDGRVTWGRMGITAEPKWPATKTYDVKLNEFDPVSAVGIAKGSFEFTGRHLHPGGNPNEQYQATITLYRVHGLIGGRLAYSKIGGDAESGEVVHAYGRGGAEKDIGTAPPEHLWVHDLDTRDWWKPVENHIPVAPGEHPRLLFRESDLPAIRKRAETPEGKKIVAHLRTLLGNNGEAAPDRFSEVPPHNHRKTKPMPVGTFTTWHAAGFGFLYQLTGEKKYAELAQGCVQMMLDGKYDIDNRYSWIQPGTDLRCGSVLAAMAYAYDFCYDAWKPDFRKKIALEIQNFDKVTASSEAAWKQRKAQGKAVPETPPRTDIKKLAGRTKYPPGSNHYGSLIGGTGVALLAIQGDPGTDTAFVSDRLREIESNIPRMLTLGFGDAGWFAEGFGSSSSLSRLPMTQLIQAMRCAAGRDYLHPQPNAQWMMLTWIMHIGGHGKRQMPNRGVYEGDSNIGRTGEFPVGFGAIEDKYVPALLWTYKTFVEDPSGLPAWIADRPYPHHAIYALLNWPIGVEPANPANVLPLTAVDHIHGYFVARNRWKNKDDIIVTHWLGYGPPGYYGSNDFRFRFQKFGQVRIWGYGLRTGLNTDQRGAFVTHYEELADGGFTMTSGGTGFLVDFSGVSGAEAVIVAVGPDAEFPNKSEPTRNDRASTQVVYTKAGNEPAQVFTLQTGDAPAISAKEGVISVGARRYSWDGLILQPAR